MNMIVKSAAVLGLTGAMALAAMSPSEARSGRWAAAGVGFAAGALVGAAVASSNRGYYYNEPYAYAPGPVYYDTAPAYRYSAPAYSYGYGYDYADSYAYAPVPRRGVTRARNEHLTSSDY